MKFDYKLYHGPTTTRNAILLLERMGYPEEIIRMAGRYVNSINHYPQDSLADQNVM